MYSRREQRALRRKLLPPVGYRQRMSCSHAQHNNWYLGRTNSGRRQRNRVVKFSVIEQIMGWAPGTLP
jgi:hypothetical protein